MVTVQIQIELGKASSMCEVSEWPQSGRCSLRFTITSKMLFGRSLCLYMGCGSHGEEGMVPTTHHDVKRVQKYLGKFDYWRDKLKDDS